MLRLTPILLILALLMVSCEGDTSEADIEPLELLTEAAENIRAADTFRLYVEQTGASYFIPIYLGADIVNVEFRFARAQYVAPDVISATARIVTIGLALDAEIFSRDDDQWYRIPAGAGPWINADFAPGFNPASLIAEDSGFQAALTALLELEYIGEETLEDGTPVYHLKGIANGPDVTALVVGLIDAQADVPVDVYINRENRYPVRLVLTQPETITADEPEPTTWTIDVFDVDAASEIEAPDGETVP